MVLIRFNIIKANVAIEVIYGYLHLAETTYDACISHYMLPFKLNNLDNHFTQMAIKVMKN